jgi:hypothetical protein
MVRCRHASRLDRFVRRITRRSLQREECATRDAYRKADAAAGEVLLAGDLLKALVRGVEVLTMLFRTLTAAEEARFRAWTRDNYEPGSKIDGVWHPSVQDECVRINRERAVLVADTTEVES